MKKSPKNVKKARKALVFEALRALLFSGSFVFFRSV